MPVQNRFISYFLYRLSLNHVLMHRCCYFICKRRTANVSDDDDDADDDKNDDVCCVPGREVGGDVTHADKEVKYRGWVTTNSVTPQSAWSSLYQLQSRQPRCRRVTMVTHRWIHGARGQRQLMNSTFETHIGLHAHALRQTDRSQWFHGFKCALSTCNEMI